MTDRMRAALKTATYVLVDRLGGPDAASCATRVSKTVLGDYCRPQSAHFMPVDVLADLIAVPGAPLAVVQALAGLRGHALVPIVPQAPGELPALLAKLGAEVGDVFAASARALADGTVSEAERAELARELSEMVAAGQAALGALLPGGAKGA